MTSLSVGDMAPDFTLETDDGAPLTLSTLRGRAVVLYFYPQDDTEGCTVEAIEFTALRDEFAVTNIDVIGISPDSVDDHCAFRDKYDLGIRLVSDPDHRAIDAYGLWGEKTNFGRKYMGLIRTTFLIDGKGRIAEIWTVRRIKGHAAAVLDAARALTA